jgi:hypothetical protein
MIIKYPFRILLNCILEVHNLEAFPTGDLDFSNPKDIQRIGRETK